jgi:hypothetical protein
MCNLELRNGYRMLVCRRLRLFPDPHHTHNALERNLKDENECLREYFDRVVLSCRGGAKKVDVRLGTPKYES